MKCMQIVVSYTKKKKKYENIFNQGLFHVNERCENYACDN